MYSLKLTKRGKSRFVLVPEREHYNGKYVGDEYVREAPTPFTATEYAERYPTKRFRFKPDGSVTYRRGQLTVEFDASGKAIEGWSYWTCIFCFSGPTEDFPNGRLIYNDSGYGSTTGGHIGEMREFFKGDAIGNRDVTHSYRNRDGEGRMVREYYTHSETIYANELTMADQICWYRGVRPYEMREELATMERHNRMGVRLKAYNAWAKGQDIAQAEINAADRARAHNDGLASGSIVSFAARKATVAL